MYVGGSSPSQLEDSCCSIVLLELLHYRFNLLLLKLTAWNQLSARFFKTVFNHIFVLCSFT